MMQPSGRAMHNGKVYELWGDELWEYSPDVETGETTVRVVGQVGNLAHPPDTSENWDQLRQTAAGRRLENADLRNNANGCELGTTPFLLRHQMWFDVYLPNTSVAPPSPKPKG